MTSINAAMPTDALTGAGYDEAAPTVPPGQAVSGGTGAVTTANTPRGTMATPRPTLRTGPIRFATRAYRPSSSAYSAR